MKLKLLIGLFACFANPLLAQLPDTDIWLLDVKGSGDKITLENLVNITQRPGYDNQPAFSPDGKYILYTSIRDGKQSDIYKYDLNSKQISQFTNTATSEYSPTFMPSQRSVSVVMVEADSTQRLWKFPLKGGAPQLLLKSVDSVGYHCWLSDSVVALFLITKPFKLVYMNTRTGRSQTIMNDTVMRSMKVANGLFYYGYRHRIYECGPGMNEFGLCLAIQNAPSMETEDFAVLGEKFLMADKSIVYITGSKKGGKLSGNEWLKAIDLSSYGIKKVTRIAVSPNGRRIAVVAE